MSGFFGSLPDPRIYNISKTSWYIDPINGYDDYEGSESFPIKTNAELIKRWGSFPTFDHRVDIYYISAPSNSDYLLLNATVADSGMIFFHGIKTELATGQISAVTARSSATNQAAQITDVSMTWATYIGNIVEITSSSVPANVGACAYIAKDLGSNVARMSTFLKTDQTLISGATTEITPAVGDNYSIYSFMDLQLYHINCIGQTQATSTYNNGIFLQYLNFTKDNDRSTASFTFMGGNGYVRADKCSFAGGVSVSNTEAGVVLSNCVFSDTIKASVAILRGGLLKTPFTGGNSSLQGGTISNGTLFQNHNILFFNNKTSITITDIAFFDWTSWAISIDQAHAMITSRFWGSSIVSGSFPIRIINSGKLTANTSTLVIEADASYDFKLGSSTSTRPYDDSTGTYATAILNSWANLAAALSSGFAGNVINPITGDSITARIT